MKTAFLIGSVLSFSAMVAGCAHKPPVKSEKARVPVAQAPIQELASSLSSANYVSLPPATFEMGSPVSEIERWEDEVVHSVTLTEGFQILDTAVTQAQWMAVMGFNPSKFKEKANCPKEFDERFGGFCPNHPVDGISWFDAEELVQKMNERVDGFVYRLPTEAEWEYAARAGSRTAFHFGNDIRQLDRFGWHEGNSGQQTHAVRGKKPNHFGLFDIHGNVFEWVQDWYDPYPEGAVQNPKGPATGTSRIIRGGTYGLSGFAARSSNRGMADPDVRSIGVGVRLVRSQGMLGRLRDEDQVTSKSPPLEFSRDGDRIRLRRGDRQTHIPFEQFKTHLEVALLVPADYRPEIRKQFDTYKHGAREGSKETGRTLVSLRTLLANYGGQIADKNLLKDLKAQISKIEKALGKPEDLPVLIHQTNELVTKVANNVFEKPSFTAKLSYKDSTRPEYPILLSYLKTPGVAAEFIRVHPGEFEMGSDPKEPVRDANEVQHQVRITKDFEIQKTELTQMQWYLVMGYNPSEFRRKENCPEGHVILNGVELCAAHPVEMISWFDAQAFIRRLNDSGDGFRYRMPTEAEWEFAVRAGTSTTFNFGNDMGPLPEHAWFYGNCGDQTRPTGLKRAAVNGLFDMYGNVWEWTQDWYADYPKGETADPRGASSGKFRSIRGGSWFSLPKNLRSANRGNADPMSRASIIGMRLVRTPAAK